MQNQTSIYFNRAKILLVGSLLGFTLVGCGSTNWGFPYKATVQQGNWVTEKQASRLETGMTREQVRFLLGTPTLQDIFHADRWDYPFYNKPGYGDNELRKFTVWFENDLLVRWSGDEQPDRQPYERTDSGKKSLDQDAEPSNDKTSTEEKASTDTEPEANNTDETVEDDKEARPENTVSPARLNEANNPGNMTPGDTPTDEISPEDAANPIGLDEETGANNAANPNRPKESINPGNPNNQL